MSFTLSTDVGYDVFAAPLEDALDTLKVFGVKRDGVGQYEQSSVTICPLCLDPILSSPLHQTTTALPATGEDQMHSRPASPTCLAACSHSHLYHGACLQAHSGPSTNPPFNCLFCRADTKVMGIEAIAKLVCEAMVAKPDDLAIQLKANHAIVCVGYRNRPAIELFELCGAPKLVCASLTKFGDNKRLAGTALEAIAVLCQGDTPGKHRLGEVNAPALVCAAMKKHHSKNVDLKGVTAIAQLAKLDTANVLQSEWADASFLVLAAMKRNYLNTAVLLQGLEAIEALSYYGLHPDSALIVAEAHKLIPALLVANLGDKEVAQLALRVMNRILASRKVCELFSDAGLAKWLGKAMGYFQSEMSIQKGCCQLITSLSRQSDSCRIQLAGLVGPLSCKTLRTVTCPSVLASALEAIATMTTSPIDDPLVANNLGARDMCAAVVGVVRVCLTATVQNRDLYFHALRAINALTLEPSNHQRLIDAHVKDILERLYKIYKKDEEIQTELSILAECIDFERRPSQWEMVANVVSSLNLLRRSGSITDLLSPRGSRESSLSRGSSLSRAGSLSPRATNDLLEEAAKKLTPPPPSPSIEPAQGNATVPTTTSTINNIRSRSAPTQPSSSSSCDTNSNNNSSNNLILPPAKRLSSQEQQQPQAPASSSTSSSKPFRFLVSFTSKSSGVQVANNVVRLEDAIGAALNKSIIPTTTTITTTIPVIPDKLPDVVVKGTRHSTGGAHHGRPSRDGSSSSSTPPQVKRRRSAASRRRLSKVAGDAPAMLSRPLDRISERASSGRSCSAAGRRSNSGLGM